MLPLYLEITLSKKRVSWARGQKKHKKKKKKWNRNVLTHRISSAWVETNWNGTSACKETKAEMRKICGITKGWRGKWLLAASQRAWNLVGKSCGTDCRKWETHVQEEPGHIQSILTFFFCVLIAKEKIQDKQASCLTWCSCLCAKPSHESS